MFEVQPQHHGGPERLFVTTTAPKKKVEQALAGMKESYGSEAISSALAGMGHWHTVGTWGGEIKMGDFGLRKYSGAEVMDVGGPSAKGNTMSPAIPSSL